MKALITALVLLLIALVAMPEQVWAQDKVKSYREWKTDKVQEVETRVSSLKTRLTLRKTDPNLARSSGGTEGKDIESQRLESQLRNEQTSLEMAKELTVSDYFAGYLTKLSDKNSAFKEVAGKLTAEEVAELMAAYANSVFGTQTGNLPASAQNMAPETVK